MTLKAKLIEALDFLHSILEDRYVMYPSKKLENSRLGRMELSLGEFLESIVWEVLYRIKEYPSKENLDNQNLEN